MRNTQIINIQNLRQIIGLKYINVVDFQIVGVFTQLLLMVKKVKDYIIHKDQNDNLWIFLNKKYNNSDDCSDLYIYKIDSLKFKKIYYIS